MIETITTGIVTAIATVGFAVMGLLGIAPSEPEIVQVPVQVPVVDESFGSFAPIAGGTYRLKSSIGTTDTTITLSSFDEPITGNNITMSTIGSDIAYATIDPQSSTRKEFISFTGVTQNSDGSATLTGVSRGLAFQTPFTASTTLRKSHPGQSILILSDSPQLFNEYARRRANETITGQWTFDIFPITGSSSYAGATTTGWVELATGEEAASSTLRGDITTSRLAIGTDISTSSAPASGNVVVVTQDDGNIDTGFLPDLLGSSTLSVFTTSQAWTKPSDFKYIIVEVVGGGGGGGGGNTSSQVGGSGGGGGYSKALLSKDDLSATSSVYVTIGGGGSGGTGGGATGGTTKFSTLLQATGGAGGEGYAGGGDGGAGGVGSGGHLNINGQGGAAGANGTSQIGSGPGGNSYFGGGARGVHLENGADATAYGGGGSGAHDFTVGGDGYGGVAVITVFY